jgi:photosystem II stability/assembly factor-like uncharacterized protein
MYKTTDRGILWEEKSVNGIDSLLFAGEFHRIFFISSNVGWALNKKYVIKTTDGGESWQSQLNSGGLSLTGIYFSDLLNGWVTRSGFTAKPYKTIDGGDTWIVQTNITLTNTNDVFFNDSLNGFISRNNELYRTTDGGLTWTLTPGVTAGAGIFSNKISGQIFLAGGRSYQSTDSGETWNEVMELYNRGVRFISLLNFNEGYAVGETDLILHYKDSVVDVGNSVPNIPNEYCLYQNYPNPFNPDTKIEFQLPETAFVNLIVYNILGEKIVELIKERLNAGHYEFIFKGDQLPSGTYIYSLQTENYKESRKMILLK